MNLAIALRALNAARLALTTVQANIAGAATPGYARRDVLFGSSLSSNGGPLDPGGGPNVERIRRTADVLIEGDLRLATASLGTLEGRRRGAAAAQGSVDPAGDNSIGRRLGELYDKLGALSSTPADPTQRVAVVDLVRALADDLRRARRGLDDAADDAGRDLAGDVAEANRLLEELAAINLRFARAGGEPAAFDLRDRRDQVLGQLAELLPVRARETRSGAVVVQADGFTLLSNDRAHRLSVDASGPDPALSVDGTDATLVPTEGRLAGHLRARTGTVPEVRDQLDELARFLIGNLNHAQSIGLGTAGRFRSLVSEVAVPDRNGDGDPRNDPLASAGLAFPPTAGELLVTVTEDATGVVTQRRITLDPEREGLAALAARLSGVPGLSADADLRGRLRITAATGFSFEFTNRLDPDPDDGGFFGSPRPTVSGTVGQPFALAAGRSLGMALDGGTPVTVTFQAADFANIARATAEEVAAVLQRDVPGLTARAVAGRVVVQGPTAGPAGTLALTDGAGTPLATLGLAAGLETGRSGSVAPGVQGSYTGTETGLYRFEALGSGTVGVTPGLQVAAYDPSGVRVTLLDVGAGYAPGSKLDVADGFAVTFRSGELRQSAGDFFSLYVTPDPDQGRLLASVGLNVLFTGSNASDIEVSAELLTNPARLGTHRGGTEASNLSALLAVRALKTEELNGLTGEDWVLDLLARVGNEQASVEDLTETGIAWRDGLRELRESVSGVSIEEELLQLSRYQNLFESTLRVTQVIDQVMQEVFALVVP